jgi:hypothetical protein
MNLQFAALYDVIFGVHQFTALGLILIAVAITVITVLSRNQEGMLEKAIPLVEPAGVGALALLASGVYQVLHLNETFFQLWIIGPLLLLVGFIGTLHGVWRPKARAIVDGEIPEDEIKQTKTDLSGVAGALIVMLIAAAWLMESGG